MKSGVQVRDYLFEDLIGVGGMGEVWKARHVHLGTHVAIKIMASHLSKDPGFADRFLHEARTMARLEHPQIVGIKDFFEEGGERFLVMPFIEGEPLDEILSRQGGPLDPERAVRIALDVLEGLDYAHSRGVIHRDVKPSNILVDRSGGARITDFGIALMLGNVRLTKTGTSLGTPHYMSPEQIECLKDLDHRADIYSTGCVLFEMLTGRPPFVAVKGTGNSDYLVMKGHTSEVPPKPSSLMPHLPPDMDRIIHRALQKDPRRRFQYCREFQEALRGGEPSGQGTADRALGKGFRWVMGGAAALLAIAAIFLAFNFRRPRAALSDGIPPAGHGYSTSAPQTNRPAEPPPDHSQVRLDEGEVRDFVENWRLAWQGRNLSRYSSCYAETFYGRNVSKHAGTKTMNRNQWMVDKSTKFQVTGDLSITLKDLSIVIQRDEATVTFQQLYQAQNYQDTGTKTLVIRKDSAGHLKIIIENFSPDE